MSNHPYKSTTHDERYIHFKDNVFPYRAITIFAREESKGSWFIAPAFCVVSDNFERHIGRKIARRRYFLGSRTYVGTVFDYDLIRKTLRYLVPDE